MSGYDNSPDYGGPPERPFDWLRVLALFLVILAAMFWVDRAARAEDNMIAGRASVVDGDTIEIHGTRIRLWGIDAPESNQTCTSKEGQRQRVGQQASFVLSDLAEGKTVSCLKHTRDRYGRPVASCSVDGTDLSSYMVTNGWAWAFTRYSSDYVSDEQHARASIERLVPHLHRTLGLEERATELRGHARATGRALCATPGLRFSSSPKHSGVPLHVVQHR